MEIDKSNMRQKILNFPKQFKKGIETAKNVKVSGQFNKILVCAMGGSALPADILSTWVQVCKIKLSIKIHRSYNLPYYADKNHLIICISYSGNTEETLSAFEQARKKKLKIITITSGGKLAELCKKYKIPLAIVPKGEHPRMALGFQFAALVKSLVNCKVIKNNKLKNVSILEKNLNPQKIENQGKGLAKKLKNKIPIIYTSNELETLARIWKIKFNENSKIPAFYNCFPELNHNEMAGYNKNSKIFYIIILQDSTAHPKILKRIKLFTDIIKAKKIRNNIIEMKDKDVLYKIFSNLLLADWASYYLALENKIDPSPVEIIEQFKKKMSATKPQPH